MIVYLAHTFTLRLCEPYVLASVGAVRHEAILLDPMSIFATAGFFAHIRSPMVPVLGVPAHGPMFSDRSGSVATSAAAWIATTLPCSPLAVRPATAMTCPSP